MEALTEGVKVKLGIGFYRLVIVAALLTSSVGLSDGGDTVVTTYITKRQEERESTKWTLTEWLRIRERSKMMDVWLAMFSNPQKDVFAPELNGTYLVQKAAVKVIKDGATEEGSYTARVAGGQIFLTNLFTYTTKRRTLNVDLGGEGFIRETEAFKLTSGPFQPINRRETLKYFLGSLRVFGKNIQDSSLILKYGQYYLGSSLASRTVHDLDENVSGQAAGAEMQLYLFRWLGVEGQGQRFGDQSSAFATSSRSGLSFQYGPYIEISILRLVGGWYKEAWTFTKEEKKISTSDEGFYAGIKVLL